MFKLISKLFLCLVVLLGLLKGDLINDTGGKEEEEVKGEEMRRTAM